jgi:GMP synthase-like glutamine amidotransferase
MAIVIFEHSADCSAELLIDSLRGFGQRLRVVKLHAGAAVPADLDDVHGVVSLGGPQTVHEMNAPWMQAEMGFLRDAHGAGIPVLGLCLGAQLLAAALGGETGRMPAPEVGWKRMTLSPQGREDAMFAGQPWSVEQFCKVQAFAVGHRTYGLQYHAEWSAATVKHQVEGGAAELKAAGADAAAILADTTKFADTSARLAKRFFDAVSVLLMPADRLNKGIVKDLHH